MSCAYQLVVVYLIIGGICFSLPLMTMSHGFMIKFMTTLVVVYDTHNYMTP